MLDDHSDTHRGGGVSEGRDGIYRLSQSVLSAPVGGETVLLTMDSEKYFGVRGAMQHLIEGLREGLSVDDMVDQTCARYEVEPDLARSDIQSMLAKLIAADIVERTA